MIGLDLDPVRFELRAQDTDPDDPDWNQPDDDAEQRLADGWGPALDDPTRWT